MKSTAALNAAMFQTLHKLLPGYRPDTLPADCDEASISGLACERLLVSLRNGGCEEKLFSWFVNNESVRQCI